MAAAKASRAAFGEMLLDLAARDERIVTLDADLSKSTMTATFAKASPARASRTPSRPRIR
jgi:transketolase